MEPVYGVQNAYDRTSVRIDSCSATSPRSTATVKRRRVQEPAYESARALTRTLVTRSETETTVVTQSRTEAGT